MWLSGHWEQTVVVKCYGKYEGYKGILGSRNHGKKINVGIGTILFLIVSMKTVLKTLLNLSKIGSQYVNIHLKIRLFSF